MKHFYFLSLMLIISLSNLTNEARREEQPSGGGSTQEDIEIGILETTLTHIYRTGETEYYERIERDIKGRLLALFNACGVKVEGAKEVQDSDMNIIIKCLVKGTSKERLFMALKLVMPAYKMPVNEFFRALSTVQKYA